MRTTITIDEDVHGSVSYYARAKGITFSAAVCELIRKAQDTPEPPPDIRLTADGFPTFPPVSGPPLTEDWVKKLEDEEFEPNPSA